jgi:DNA-binding PadR family transcriptional regulator
MRILIKYLLEDGLVRIASPAEVGAQGSVTIMGVPAQEYVAITPKGQDFITRWLRAQDLEQT